MSKKYRIVLLVSIALVILTMGSVVMAQTRSGRDTDNPPYGSGMQTQAMDCSQTGMMYQRHGQMGQVRGQMYQGNMNAQSNCYFSNEPLDVELNEAEIEAMVSGLLDEYHAYDVYAAVIEQFGNVRPFTNIMNAEAQHITAWERIFTRYGVDLPDRPTVDVPEFGTLADACSLAAEAEIANAGLYDAMLETLADYPDIVQMITNLRDASFNNHLPAFEQCSN